MQNQDIKQLVLDAAHRRRAIKFFDTEKKISDDDITYILETEGIVTMLALGYRTEELPWPQTRKPAEEVITWVK
ncbi:hypothetical protein [Rothia nasimurium]|uniref:hypothetical protein n=1 Tax=Rothia nasimurium TaxID=85336 RepID=UPI001F2DDC83|nr:hypothetical protein [Rothia nasimurium]